MGLGGNIPPGPLRRPTVSSSRLRASDPGAVAGDRTLVFGFLPIGLAYHVGYSLAAAALMAVMVRFAWPGHLEDAGNSTHSEPGQFPEPGLIVSACV